MVKQGKKLRNYRTINVLGVKVDLISLEETISRVDNWLDSNKKHQITTPNPEQIIIAQSDYRFKKIINNSALAIADGIGLIWAAGRGERLSGVDLMTALCRRASQKGWRVFLLGGKKRAAAKAAQQLKKENRNLKISFYQSSENIKKQKTSELKKTLSRINHFQPELLFVAYGAPIQEKWIAANLGQLKIKAAMGVGGAFDYLAGRVKRAPVFWRKLGLEWLWRLIQQPWRWKRQQRLIKFIFLITKEKMNTAKGFLFGGK